MSKKEEERILRTHLASTFLIGSVMLLEVAAGILTNSLAILGDAIHAAYDFLVTGMLFITYRISLKPADESHTYGHSRIKTLGSFASSIMLLYLVAQLILQSLDRLTNPSPVHPGPVGFLALAYTLAVDSTRITLLSKAPGGEPSLKAGMFHALADFSDTLIALLGFTLAGYFNMAYADVAAGLLLSAMMLYLSTKLLYETGLELTDAASPAIVRRIRRVLEEEYGVDGVSYLNVRRLDKKTYVDVGALVPVESSVSSIQKSVKNVEEKISRIVEGEVVVRTHTFPKGSENLRGIIKDSALRVKNVLNVHDILVSQTNGKMLVSLHIEVPADMSLSEAHRIADEVEENVLKNVQNVGSVMVHVETAGSAVTPIRTIGSNSTLYLKVKQAVEEEVKQFHSVKGLRRIRVFKEASGLNRIELTVSMEGDRSMAEAHEAASRLEHRVEHSLEGKVEVVVHVEPEDQA
ncbi:MAG: cation diffusion facilitator family transporter [Candidatus Brockarchaeota archaeon]|nr:cation diffusion facilitator family transporter [Candidatus Brockarchaeota archaeon]